jgi:hypothetical protein
MLVRHRGLRPALVRAISSALLTSSTLLLVGLSACTQHPKRLSPMRANWWKVGASQADQDRDKYDCDLSARQMLRAKGLSAAAAYDGEFERCMEAHGWERPTYDTPPTPSAPIVLPPPTDTIKSPPPG